MIVETSSVVFARAKSDALVRWANAIASASGARGEPYSHESPDYGLVEIVEVKTTAYYRDNKTRMPGREKEVTETVLLTLNADEARHLIASTAGAMLDALNTGPRPTLGRTVETQED